MSAPGQIGDGTDVKILRQILRQLEMLTRVVAKLNSTTTTTTTITP